MRLRNKILLVLTILIILVIIGIHAYVNIYGKRLVINKLEDIFKRKVSVGSVKAYIPLSIIVKDIEVQDLFKIDKAFALGGAIDVFRKDFTLYQLKLNHLVLNIQKYPKSETTVSEAGQNPPAEITNITIPANASVANITPPSPVVTGDYSPESRQMFRFSIFNLKHLVLNDSVINFIDKSVVDKEVKVTIDKLNASIENLEFPMRRSNIISFSLKGRIPQADTKDEGSIEFNGWINLFKKDMQAKLKAEGIDGIGLYPYYSSWINLEKTKIQKAKLSFTSNIQGLNNDVSAQCTIKLTSIEFKPHPPEEGQERAEKIARIVLDMFRSLNQGDIVLNFTLKTQMDSPQFGLGIIRSAFEDKLSSARRSEGLTAQNIIKAPGKMVSETVSSVSDITRAFIGGAVSIGQELRKVFEGALIPQEEEAEGQKKDEDVFFRIANKTNNTNTSLNKF